MCHHSQLCKLALASIDKNDNNNQEDKSITNDNGKDNDNFAFG